MGATLASRRIRTFVKIIQMKESENADEIVNIKMKPLKIKNVVLNRTALWYVY
jgi:hypothetical protein